jgi:hypothetical protein
MTIGSRPRVVLLVVIDSTTDYNLMAIVEKRWKQDQPRSGVIND